MRFAALVPLVLALAACQSAVEKTAKMCSDMKQVVETNKDDCDQMAVALRAWFDQYKDERAFGSPDPEEMRKAQQGCNEAGQALAASCVQNPKVIEVMRDIQAAATK